MKLTGKTTAAAKLPPGKADHIFWDDSVAGFGLRTRASGGQISKSWVAQYRSHGRTRRMKIGAFEKLSAEDARKQARKLLAQVEMGGDPQSERRARRHRDGQTLLATAESFLAAKRPHVRDATFRGLAHYLVRGPHFRPLHRVPLDQVTRKDVAARVAKVSTDSGVISARRARAALSELYAWAVASGLCESNPVVGSFNPPPTAPRERVLSDDELAAIWHAAGDGPFGKIVRLLILTAARRSEICGLRWSELVTSPDGTTTWNLPSARSKNRKGRSLPMPPMAMEIVRAIPRVVGRDHLFGERSDLGFTKWGAKTELEKRLGLAKWTLHDLRRSAATGMADIAIPPHIIETILGHISGHKGGPAGIYNRSDYGREVKAALLKWSDHVAEKIAGVERKVVVLAQEFLEAKRGQL